MSSTKVSEANQYKYQLTHFRSTFYEMIWNNSLLCYRTTADGNNSVPTCKVYDYEINNFYA